MLTIDGRTGEGGGQVLRTALALSLATGTPFRMRDIRAGRPKPGLRAQHLAAVRAAAQVGAARVTGAEPGSHEIVFRPHGVRPGEHRVEVGTAGSAVLVLQTILLPLCVAGAPSDLVLVGATHNPLAPPYEFLAGAYLPVLRRMGVHVEAELDRPCFFPAGGGRLRVKVGPAATLGTVRLVERGDVLARRARICVANLPQSIADREAAVVLRRTGWPASELAIDLVPESPGPGNAVVLEVTCEDVTEVFSAFGGRRVRAETVADRAVDGMRRWLDAGVPVGPHLADQILLPLALAGGGSFRTLPLSAHATTNADVIRLFLPVRIDVAPSGPGAVRVEVARTG
jgi:RNA 3'-terminal phosphate cyclase (ATP)